MKLIFSLIYHLYFFPQTKSEHGAVAPSTGSELHMQPPQPTSSHAPSLTNTVRIEKLSDDEDEDVDITDDLSDDGDADNKLQAALKIEQPTDPEIQTGCPTQEQEEVGQTETEDKPGHSCLTPQSPQSSSSLPDSEECGVTELDQKGQQTVSPLPINAHNTDEQETQSCRSESSTQKTRQLEEGCSDGTGETFVVETFFLLHLLVKNEIETCQ